MSDSTFDGQDQIKELRCSVYMQAYRLQYIREFVTRGTVKHRLNHRFHTGLTNSYIGNAIRVPHHEMSDCSVFLETTTCQCSGATVDL